jgi:NAD(P)-dependent dehydrogenase (short-subunit alcohol dehydrogenase family)
VTAELFDLSGRTVLVTGAGRGIGRAVTLGLAQAGADVVGLSRTPADLDTLGPEVRAIGRDFLSAPADVADVSAILDAADAAWSWKGGVDVLVNAAGTIVRVEPPNVTPDQWASVFDVNVRGTFFLTQEVGRRMLAGDGGTVVTIASLAGEVVTRASVVYQASKAALIQMTRALAVRWAPSIRVNAVGPGYIRTSLNGEWLDEEENRRYVLERTPMGRVGAPEDVIGAVLFLASDASAYVTGQHLLVDGGWSAR